MWFEILRERDNRSRRLTGGQQSLGPQKPGAYRFRALGVALNERVKLGDRLRIVFFLEGIPGCVQKSRSILGIRLGHLDQGALALLRESRIVRAMLSMSQGVVDVIGLVSCVIEHPAHPLVDDS